MKFALFYEIPVARPWDERSEWRAYKDVLEQAKFGDAMGWDAFWTVEHLREYEKAGPDLLLCLVNPYEIPYEAVMQTIELMGKYVIPEFRRSR